MIVDGGVLEIEWRDDGHVLMTGPVATAFHGHFAAEVVSGMTVDILTFGCRLNAYESEVMRGLSAANRRHPTDTVIVNTCAVTAEAERQARQAIRRSRAGTAGGPHRRHRLRGADRSRRVGRTAERAIACWATTTS